MARSAGGRFLGSDSDQCQRATALELKDNGSVAWITPASPPDRTRYGKPHPPEVWAADSRGRRLLDSARR